MRRIGIRPAVTETTSAFGEDGLDIGFHQIAWVHNADVGGGDSPSPVNEIRRA
jgi:hypothetical protein